MQLTSKLTRKRRLIAQPYYWVVPGMLMLGAFLYYPIAFTSFLSLFDWNGYQQDIFANFVGLGNYVKLLQDPRFFKALSNTLLFVLFAITVQLFIALMLATFIYLGEFKRSSILRGIIFFPSVLSAVVVGITWRNVIFLRYGLIHQFTTAFDLPNFFPLGEPSVVVFAIIFVAMWQGTGFNLVIFYAGLQGLEPEVVESSQIDGAGFWQLILRIIMPLQAHVILVSVILNLIGGIQIFDLVFVLAKGPIRLTHSADVLSMYMIFNSFAGSATGGGQARLGYAASIAVIMMLIMIVFAVLRTRLRKYIDY